MSTHDALVAAQLEFWPDSIILTGSEALDKWLRNAKDPKAVAYWMVLALQFDTVVFYECGQQPDGTHRWRGMRYGTNGHEYMSGFPMDAA